MILVLTQCIDEERAGALEAGHPEENLPIEGPRCARSRGRAGSPAKTLPPKGLEELVERTNDILPEAVRRAFINAQGVVIRLKANQAPGHRRSIQRRRRRHRRRANPGPRRRRADARAAGNARAASPQSSAST